MNILSSILLATTMTASPTNVPYRGVVEGYYGRPWGTEGRVSLMSFMAERNLNTFVYGPKDDPYHHAKWREPYPEKEAQDFQKLLDIAEKSNINFFWAIHLGDFKGEYDALFAKLDAMYALGVRAFAVFFDDFGAANADLHATIGNRVIKEFLEKKGDCAPLLVCPNVYWGYGHPYQRELGAKLDKSAMIMWTGKTICSDVRAEDVARITEDFQRPPFIWWNWPVNDYCRSKLLLGRLYGLDACTYAGVVLNPMENCELNKIAIHSFGEWCKDPVNFDSHKAWEEGFAKIFKDPAVAHAMKVFATHNSDQGPNGHGYHREESVEATALCRQARYELKKYGNLSDKTRRSLYYLFEEIDDAAFTLVRKLRYENYQMFWELEGWLLDTMHIMDAGIITLHLMEHRDEHHVNAVVNRLYKGHYFRRINAKQHIAKFQAATFENDRASVKPPHSANKEILPLIGDLLEFALAREYHERTGRDFSEAFGLRAHSGAKEFPKLVVYSNEEEVGIERIFEPRKLESGEWIGFQIPDGAELMTFEINLGFEEAARTCDIEVSKDGENWEYVEGVDHMNGSKLMGGFAHGFPYHFIRVKNNSSASVRVKLHTFKLKVDGTINEIEALLDALVTKPN